MKKKNKTLKQRVDAIEYKLRAHEFILELDGEAIRRLAKIINGKKRNAGSGVKFKTGSRASK